MINSIVIVLINDILKKRKLKSPFRDISVNMSKKLVMLVKDYLNGDLENFQKTKI